jgi:hypothetical protein
MIERWLNVPSNCEEIEQLGGKVDAETIRRETPAYIGRLKILSDRTFGGFLKLFGFEKTRRGLASR